MTLFCIKLCQLPQYMHGTEDEQNESVRTVMTCCQLDDDLFCFKGVSGLPLHADLSPLSLPLRQGSGSSPAHLPGCKQTQPAISSALSIDSSLSEC